MRPTILPAALAGGVVTAAVAVLLLTGSGGGASTGGPVPPPVPPGAVQIFPGATPSRASHHRHQGGSAAESQYAAGAGRGTVLSAP